MPPGHDHFESQTGQHGYGQAEDREHPLQCHVLEADSTNQALHRFPAIEVVHEQKGHEGHGPEAGHGRSAPGAKEGHAGEDEGDDPHIGGRLEIVTRSEIGAQRRSAARDRESVITLGEKKGGGMQRNSAGGVGPVAHRLTDDSQARQPQR